MVLHQGSSEKLLVAVCTGSAHHWWSHLCNKVGRSLFLHLCLAICAFCVSSECTASIHLHCLSMYPSTPPTFLTGHDICVPWLHRSSVWQVHPSSWWGAQNSHWEIGRFTAFSPQEAASCGRIKEVSAHHPPSPHTPHSVMCTLWIYTSSQSS